MNKPSPAITSFKEAVRQLADDDAAPGWLTAARTDGWQRFEETGIPGVRNERWKYTRLTGLERRPFALPNHSSDLLSKAAHSAEFADLPGPRMVFVDGCLDTRASRTNGEAGLQVRSLGAAIADDDAVAQGLLGKIAQADTHPFAALNSALLANGALIDVAPGAHIEAPVYLLFISSRAKCSLVSNPRILLNLGANSSVTVVEHHLSHDGENLVNVTTEGRIGDGARLEYHAVQDGTGGDSQINGLHLEQARNSHVTHNSVSLGGRLIRNDLHCRLLGPGSHIDMRGLYLAGDRQHVDNHTLVEHSAPHTSSQQDYKGVLHGRGRAVFNGKVLIHPGASGSEAHQNNGNLLLSRHAEIDTKPELEIYNDDVKCTHGATVGQLDKEALYYLRARGIGDATARSMLTFAFAEALVHRIGLEAVRKRIEQRVIELLPESERIRSFV